MPENMRIMKSVMHKSMKSHKTYEMSSEDEMDFECSLNTSWRGLRKKTFWGRGLRQLFTEKSWKYHEYANEEVWLWDTKLVFNEDNFRVEKWVSK